MSRFRSPAWPARPAGRSWLCAALLGAALGCAASAATAADGPFSEPRSGPLFADRVFEYINEARRAQGLSPLERDPHLEALAQEHGAAMSDRGRPSHDGFEGRFARVPRSKLCVENVAAGFARPQLLVESWRDAPSHRRNLLEPRVRRLGVASVGRYVTMFACS